MTAPPSLAPGDLLREALRRRILLVTGKGGVGRTAVSAALALAAARSGKRTLLLEIEEPSAQARSPLAELFSRPRFTDAPEPLAPGLKGALLRQENGTRAFLTSVLKVQTLADLALKMRPLVRLLQAAPSFHEMGVYYHLLTFVKAERRAGEPENEVLILDMPSSGHTLAWTALPDILLALIPTGPVARAMREGQSFMYDPEKALALIVTIAEKLPVTESVELARGLRENRVRVGGYIANRLPEAAPEAELLALDEVLRGRPVSGALEAERLRSAGASLERLRREGDAPVLCLPELEGAHGKAVVDGLTRHLLESGGDARG